MPAVRRNEPIAAWEEGDFVQGFALLRRKDVRQDRNGRDYMDLELCDARSTIRGKVWPDSQALKGKFDESDFVTFKGVVQVYRDHHQLIVEYCRRVKDTDRENGFDEAALIPTSPENIDELWRRLTALFPDALERPALQQLAREALRRFGDQLREHPAAKTIHHAYRGGLLEHTTVMAELAVKVCEQYQDIDRDLVLLGVFFHDLGKIRELGQMPNNDYTLSGQLIGHVTIGLTMLQECCAAIDDFPPELKLHLDHLILSHQGRRAYGSPVEPMTAEAFVLHAIDDLDSKLNQLRQARQSGSELLYMEPLGRSIFFDRSLGSSAPEEISDEEDAPVAEAVEALESTDG